MLLVEYKIKPLSIKTRNSQQRKVGTLLECLAASHREGAFTASLSESSPGAFLLHFVILRGSYGVGSLLGAVLPRRMAVVWVEVGGRNIEYRMVFVAYMRFLCVYDAKNEF